MGKNSKYIVLFSVPLFSISFLSSCGKNNPTNSNTNSRSNSQQLKNGKFCTDLSDNVKNPLGSYQWHLKNTGQKAFASEPGVAGEDINVNSVLKDECLSGEGVSVGVVDTGLQLVHQSLKQNIEGNRKAISVNYRDNRFLPNDPSPILC